MPPDAAERAEALSEENATLRIALRDARRELLLERERKEAAICREMAMHIRLAAAQAGRLAPPRVEG